MKSNSLLETDRRKKATRSLSVRQLLGLRTEDFLLFSCGCIVAPHAICRECFFVVCRAYIQDRSRSLTKKVRDERGNSPYHDDDATGLFLLLLFGHGGEIGETL